MIKGSNYYRYWIFSTILILFGFICLYLGEVGTTVDQEGILHEVGLALPLGGLLLITGIVIGSILSIFCLRNCYKRSRGRR
ncbi:MAG: DUF3955 domain-containing protein [Oligoflexia bacterium]|nr:DUF3955 domain-containing protein [Oligoflexia bacterium]